MEEEGRWAKVPPRNVHLTVKCLSLLKLLKKLRFGAFTDKNKLLSVQKTNSGIRTTKSLITKHKTKRGKSMNQSCTLSNENGRHRQHCR